MGAVVDRFLFRNESHHDEAREQVGVQRELPLAFNYRFRFLRNRTTLSMSSMTHVSRMSCLELHDELEALAPFAS